VLFGSFSALTFTVGLVTDRKDIQPINPFIRKMKEQK